MFFMMCQLLIFFKLAAIQMRECYKIAHHREPLLILLKHSLTVILILIGNY